MKKILFKSVANYAIEILGVFFMILIASFLSKKLSLADYGVYAILSLFMSWLELVIIGGLSRTALYKINNSDKKLKTSRLVLQAYMIAALTVLLVFACTYNLWNDFLKIDNFHYLFPFICFYAFVCAINNGFRQISIIMLKMDAIIIPNLLKHLSKFVFIFCLVSWQANYINCIIAISFSSLLSFAYYYSKIGFLLNFKFSREVISIFRFSIPLFISALCLRIFDISDVMLINFYRGATMAALYSPAHSIKLIFSLLMASSGAFIFAEFSSIYKNNQIEKLKSYITKIAIVMVIGIPFLIPGNHFLQLILVKIYSQKFNPSLNYTLPILAGSYFMIFNVIFQAINLVMNKKISYMLSSVFLLLVCVISYNLLLYFNYSLLSLAYAFVIICFVFMVNSMVQVFVNLWLSTISFPLFLKVSCIKFFSFINENAFIVKEIVLARFTHLKAYKFILLIEDTKFNQSALASLFPYQFHISNSNHVESTMENDLLIYTSIYQYKDLRSRQIIDSNNIFISEDKIVNLCHNKLALINHFKGTEFEKYFPEVNPKTFPLILKKKEDRSSSSALFIENHSELLRNDHLYTNPDYFTQAYITGDKEYSFHPLVINHKIVSHICFEFYYDTQIPIAVKTPYLYRRKFKLAYKYILIIESMLNKIQYKGFCCVDFKFQNGEIKFFEINPRLGYNARPFVQTYFRKLN